MPRSKVTLKNINFPIYPKDSKKTSSRGFVNIHKGGTDVTHGTYSSMKDNKSFNSDSLEEQPIKILLN